MFVVLIFFFFKQKTAYEMRISDWSSDVCSSDLLDLLPRIKRIRPDLPIIVMSAQKTLLTAVKAAERGAYDYLPKPFDLKELLRVVERAMSQPKAEIGRAHV